MSPFNLCSLVHVTRTLGHRRRVLLCAILSTAIYAQHSKGDRSLSTLQGSQGVRGPQGLTGPKGTTVNDQSPDPGPGQFVCILDGEEAAGLD